MPPFVGFLVEFRGKASVGPRRDDRGNAALKQLRAQPVGIKGAVGQQVICGEVSNQLRHGAQVMGLPGDKAEISQVSQRIGQGQDLGRDTAPRAAYGLALSPPFAPWPER